MSTPRPLTIAAMGALAITTVAGTLGGFALGQSTAPTPEACVVALDQAEHTISLTAEGLELSGDAVTAAATWDVEELERITGEINGLTADMGDPEVYQDAAAECRGE